MSQYFQRKQFEFKSIVYIVYDKKNVLIPYLTY